MLLSLRKFFLPGGYSKKCQFVRNSPIYPRLYQTLSKIFELSSLNLSFVGNLAADFVLEKIVREYSCGRVLEIEKIRKFF